MPLTWNRARRAGAAAVVALAIAAALPPSTAAATPRAVTAVSPALAMPGAVVAGTLTTSTLDLVARKAVSVTKTSVTYLWGGGHGVKPSGPDRTDCSGFARWAYWSALSYDIGSGSGESMRTGGKFTKVTGIPQPGDVVFFASGGRPPATHMGVYVGTDINGNRLMANNSGSNTTANVRAINGYYSDRVIGYYRLTAAPVRIITQQTALTSAISPKVAARGGKSSVTGTLRSAKGPISGVTVVLDVRNPDGTWRSAQSTTTSGTGGFRFTVTSPGYARTFQIHHTGAWKPWLSSRSAAVSQVMPTG